MIPVNTSQTPLVLEIPCSKTNLQIDSKYNQRIIRNSPRLSPEKCSPQNSSSIINPPPVSSLGKSSLPSLVQPLTNPTAFPHSQYDNSSSFSDPYPINYVHSPVDDPNFDPVIQQLKSRMKSC